MGLLLHHVSLIFILVVKATQAQKDGICGKPNPAFHSKFGRPGDVPNIGKWPWMVSLFRHGQFLCGATLVAEEFVLTDADCFEGFPSPIEVSELTATMGRLVHNGDNPNEQTKNVSVIRLSALSGTNVALLKIPKVEINDFVQPVCLDLDGRTVPVGTSCFAIGWGPIVTGGASSHLKEMNTFALDSCSGIEKDDICMSGITPKGGKGGGSVVCKFDDNWVQVAVLNLKYVASIATEDPPTGDVPSGVPSGPPFMVLQTTSRFTPFLTALTQSFPQAPPTK